MTTLEAIPIPDEPRSVFRRAQWRGRDIAVGGCLWLALVAVVHCAKWLAIPASLRLVALAIYLVLFVAILACYPLWLVRRRAAGPAWRWPGAWKLTNEWLIAVPLSIGLVMLTGTFGCLWQLIARSPLAPPGTGVQFFEYLDYPGAVLLAVFMVVVGPIAEELFFRGFLYNGLRGVCPISLAVVLQAVVFGVSHPYYPAGLVLIGGFGLALAGIYEWRKTLLTPIFVHGMYNGAIVLIFVATMRGAADAPVLGVQGAQDSEGQVVVSQVTPGTAAERADIRPGDVIVSYNDTAVNDFPELVVLVRAGRVGDTVSIEILRDGVRLEKQATLGPRREAYAPPAPP